jgi:large subunit ribosomal protein L25
LFELKMEGDGESHYAIIQELQRNTRTDAFLHVDFKEVVRGKEMEADIPVRTRGVADGVRNYGGVLEISANTLRVRCLPRHLPEAIVIEVTELSIGRSIHLSEIEAGEGITFLGDPELVVVACGGASGGAEDEADEAEEEVVDGEVAETAGEEAAPAASEA